ncbi:hypothetical protein [Aureimonas leprariae]|uniref:Uncharacterized protein n=1 Tax=Plantimonas leprariae TaxID=2615207 RepID=A0A7V7TY61_9HYPH|nr:hypothetical protein [Aureimonas leprariae]KAB0676708.1 hypothetical protein F6X38_20625 [Aureimonas leprariae]
MSVVRPVLMRLEEVVGVKDAMRLSGKSEVTIRRLCRRHGLARQTTPSAPLEISRTGLEMVLHGDLDALEMLRAGERSAPPVRRYLEFLNMPA